MTIKNTNPVLLDAAGRLPNVFFSGVAKAVLKDSEGEIIETRDPVGDFSAGDESFSTWSTDVSYPVNAVVAGSDGYFYVSRDNSNIANDPLLSPEKWRLFVKQIGFDGTNNGNVYTVDTSDPQGIGNVTQSSIKVMVPIATVTASNSATVDFTGLSADFSEYRVHGLNVVPASTSQQLLMRTSTNGGATYDSGGTDYSFLTIDAPSTGSSLRVLTSVRNDVSEDPGGSFEMMLINPSSAVKQKTFLWTWMQINSVGNINSGVSSGMRVGSILPVNAVRFFINTGNIQSGIFTLYGVRRT